MTSTTAISIDAIGQAINALRMIETTPHIASYLAGADPQALRQVGMASQALRDALEAAPAQAQETRTNYFVLGAVTGSHASNGDIVVRWNSQVDSLRSPDGKQKLMPCELCGEPAWVAMNVVSRICDQCSTMLQMADQEGETPEEAEARDDAARRVREALEALGMLSESLGLPAATVGAPMIRIEHEPMDSEQVPLAAFVRANTVDEEAMDALVQLIRGEADEVVLGGGAVPLATLSLVFVY